MLELQVCQYEVLYPLIWKMEKSNLQQGLRDMKTSLQSKHLKSKRAVESLLLCVCLLHFFPVTEWSKGKMTWQARAPEVGEERSQEESCANSQCKKWGKQPQKGQSTKERNYQKQAKTDTNKDSATGNVWENIMTNCNILQNSSLKDENSANHPNGEICVSNTHVVERDPRSTCQFDPQIAPQCFSPLPSYQNLPV